MKVKHIELERANYSGRLTLSDSGYTEAWRGDFIMWYVQDTLPRVNSITGFSKKNNIDPDIFEIEPAEVRGSNGRIWYAKINNSVREGEEFNYTIFWLDDRATPQRHDPKIAIKPSRNSLFNILLGILAALIAAFFSLMLFRKSKK